MLTLVDKNLFFFRFRESNLLQTLLQLHTILRIPEHVPSHQNTVHKLRQILSNLC